MAVAESSSSPSGLWLKSDSKPARAVLDLYNRETTQKGGGGVGNRSTCSGSGQGHPVPGLVGPHGGDGGRGGVLLVVRGVGLPQHAHGVPRLDRPAQDPAQGIEGRAVLQAKVI